MTEVKAPAPKVFFYGCFKGVIKDGFEYKEAGHYWRSPDGGTVDVQSPFGHYPDGTLAPAGTQYQGIAKLHQKDGWTAIGFWDRTGDERGNSNSNFVVRGTYSFDEMCKLAQEQWPELWKRIGRVTQGQ